MVTVKTDEGNPRYNLSSRLEVGELVNDKTFHTKLVRSTKSSISCAETSDVANVRLRNGSCDGRQLDGIVARMFHLQNSRRALMFNIDISFMIFVQYTQSALIVITFANVK